MIEHRKKDSPSGVTTSALALSLAWLALLFMIGVVIAAPCLLLWAILQAV